MCVFCQVYCAKFRSWGSGERGKGIKSKISLNGAYIQIIFRADILHGIQTKNNEMPFEIIDLFECCSLVILLVKMTSLKILNEGTQEDFCLLIWESLVSAFLRSLFSFLSVYSSLSFKKWAGAPFFFCPSLFLISLLSIVSVCLYPRPPTQARSRRCCLTGYHLILSPLLWRWVPLSESLSLNAQPFDGSGDAALGLICWHFVLMRCSQLVWATLSEATWGMKEATTHTHTHPRVSSSIR